ncbi:hypothetical protein RND71_037590 [Anisodus tanguticus]|uniref:Cardiolipin synthase N-terminal domain-containing protein n=1 Tax=Anisodus tanguticus TaxID=243964 RepID=A0AAE1QXD0_9SOLA|nr:hypothetical protein RND71_037590 [Anisodus tanguticus]
MDKDEDNELGGESNNGDQWDRTTSFVLFGLWSGLMCYVFFLAPNQTPVYQMEMSGRNFTNTSVKADSYDKGSWLLPLSVIPFLGPALYLLLRPSVPTVAVLYQTQLGLKKNDTHQDFNSVVHGGAKITDR